MENVNHTDHGPRAAKRVTIIGLRCGPWRLQEEMGGIRVPWLDAQAIEKSQRFAEAFEVWR